MTTSDALPAPAEPSPQTAGTGDVIENRVSGDVSGPIVQAGTVNGNINIAAPVSALAAARTLPSDIASFVGRESEIGHVSDLAASGGVVRISAVAGMAGAGKTAFATHVAHELAPRFPDGQIFLNLYGHTPGQRAVEPFGALATLLLTLGVAPQQIPTDLQARVALWRDRMAERKVLLVLDDVLSTEQVAPLLPGTAGSLVIITSRRRLTALSEALAITMNMLEPAEAAGLFVRLAGRPSLSPTDPAVTEIVSLCSGLPLAVSLMAGHLKHHPNSTITDLAGDLRSTADALPALHAEHSSVSAAFDLSYQNLSASQQAILRRLGLHPGVDIDRYAAAALMDTTPAIARELLESLYNHCLIEEPTHGRFRPHDLIREHARQLAAADSIPERDAALRRLLRYYRVCTGVADRFLTRRALPSNAAEAGAEQPWLPSLQSRAQAAAWMDAERQNLLASCEYAQQHGYADHVVAISAVMHSFLRTQGHWDEAIRLHQASLQAARYAGDTTGELNSVNDLGVLWRLTGNYPAATTCLAHALELSRAAGDTQRTANSLKDLGLVQRLTGNYAAATVNLTEALELFRTLGDRNGQATSLNYLGASKFATGDYQSAIADQECALALYRESGNAVGEGNARTSAGLVHYTMGDFPAAAETLTEALALYRQLGDINGEANALKNLGPVQAALGDTEEGARTLTAALALYRDLGNRNGEAEALNHLGTLALSERDLVTAHSCHEQALGIALEIGAPEDEAHALEGLARLHLTQERADEGRGLLLRAQALYKRLGSARAGAVEDTLLRHPAPGPDRTARPSDPE
ncbi:tetratricopeptide repeat protein [Streptomyces sp. B21-108]|jgi:tetratricopeptide (TPR) repeat protein